MEENHHQMIEIPQINNNHHTDSDSDSNSSNSDSNSDDSDQNKKHNHETINEDDEALYNDNQLDIIELFDKNGMQIVNPNLPIGNNIILQNGNLIIGIKSELSQFFIVILCGLFLLISWLILIYPYFIYGTQFISISLLIIVNYFLAQYYHVITFITEPGILPRNHPIYQTPFGSDIYTYVPGNLNLAEQKSCSICGIDRPKLVYHCNRCENCVEEYDHFVANCVGKRNRKYFVYFLFYTCIFLSSISITSFIQIIGLGFLASNLFLDLFSNLYINISLSVGLCFSLISYPIFKTLIYLRFGIAVITCLYILMFYWYKAYHVLDYFINPFGVGMFLLSIQILLIPFCMLTTQLKLISIGFTSNQYTNLIDYRNSLNESSEHKDILTIVEEIPVIKDIPQLNFLEKIKNFKFFYKRKCPPSLLAQIYKTI